MEQRNMPKYELFDYREAGEFLGLSEFTLRRYVSRGRLPYLKLGPHLVRFEPERLREWLESRRIEPASGGHR
jgi:excisionase family DNA binding protein